MARSKSLDNGDPIEYRVPPKPISARELGSFSVCDNCAACGNHKTFVVHVSKTDFATESGSIASKRTAKPRELWLCEDCFRELFEAMEPFYRSLEANYEQED